MHIQTSVYYCVQNKQVTRSVLTCSMLMSKSVVKLKVTVSIEDNADFLFSYTQDKICPIFRSVLRQGISSKSMGSNRHWHLCLGEGFFLYFKQFVNCMHVFSHSLKLLLKWKFWKVYSVLYKIKWVIFMKLITLFSHAISGFFSGLKQQNSWSFNSSTMALYLFLYKKV